MKKINFSCITRFISVWIDIIGMIVTLLITTFSVVFMGIFGLKLYDEINNISNYKNEIE